MSSAVRPMAISPDERYAYMQLSFLHGFVEFDLRENRPLRIASLPISADVQRKTREEYLLDSAHHGLAMNRAGTKLCVAGTMSDYVAIVDRKTFSLQHRLTRARSRTGRPRAGTARAASCPTPVTTGSR